jgi:phospholipid/cholesterol/gamma-HCH transport system substrate-binding protein
VPGKHYSFDQGSDLDEKLPRSPVPNFGVFPPDWLNLTSGYAGTEAEKQIVNTMLASDSGHSDTDYGALGSLLYGPVVREGEARG